MATSLSIGSEVSPITRAQAWALRMLAKKIYAGQAIPTVQKTNLILCSDSAIRHLNRQFRKKDRSTDVLSFNYDDPDLLGEIYISLPQAQKQSREFGLTLEQEIERLFVHGMIHLCGFDHKNVKERDEMEEIERTYTGYLT